MWYWSKQSLWFIISSNTSLGIGLYLQRGGGAATADGRLKLLLFPKTQQRKINLSLGVHDCSSSALTKQVPVTIPAYFYISVMHFGLEHISHKSRYDSLCLIAEGKACFGDLVQVSEWVMKPEKGNWVFEIIWLLLLRYLRAQVTVSKSAFFNELLFCHVSSIKFRDLLTF